MGPRSSLSLISEFQEFFIKLLTAAGDLVLDPFAGSNTTDAVAEKLHCRWMAIEAVETYLQTVRIFHSRRIVHALRGSSQTLIAGQDASILLAVDHERNTMMSTVTLEEGQANLPEIIDKLAPGEELTITRNDQPVAKLVGQPRPARKPRQ